MAGVTINARPYRGEYALDIVAEPLTALEWEWIHKISGYLPLTSSEAFAQGDPRIVVAFAVVALARARKVEEAEVMAAADRLKRLPFDGASITIDFGDVEEEDPRVPALIDEPLPSGGGSSRKTSGDQAGDPSRTGAPVSLISVTSGQAISAG